MALMNKTRIAFIIMVAGCLVTLLIVISSRHASPVPIENTQLQPGSDHASPPLGHPSLKDPPSPNIGIGSIQTQETESTPLSFIDDEIFEKAGGSVETALFEQKDSDPCNFIKLTWAHGMDYKYAQRLIGKEKLPTLHKMLENPDYAPYWHRVAELIGCVSDDSNSIPILLRYIQRDDTNAWDWKSNARKNGYRMIMGKVRAFEWIGKIGGNRVNSILRDALTEEGAQRLTKAWIDGELPVLGKKGGRKEVIEVLRGRAAMGLVFTQQTDNINLVKQQYEQEHARCKANKTTNRYYGGLVCAMADQAFIEENDRESRFNLWGSGGLELKAVRPHIIRYNWRFQEK